MKALAASLVCFLALTAPSQAFFHGGGHAGPHPGGGHHHGGGVYDPFAQGVLDTYPDPNATPTPDPVVDQPPVILLPPAPLCPAAAPASVRPSGPHIIYIGQKPAIHGPKVIYGTAD